VWNTVNDKRPVNLDIGTIALPITAYTSILHRVSGVFLVAGMAVLFWLLGTSLSGPEGFAQAKECLSSFWGKLIVWAVLVGISYHAAAGVKHLVMDAGIGESMEGGERGSKLVLLTTAVLVVLTGLWVW
jgi:succinate dehydrogenase / fumarate reductase cytochrome b subunit